MMFTVCKQHIKFSIRIENNALSTPLIRKYRTYWPLVELDIIVSQGLLQATSP